MYTLEQAIDFGKASAAMALDQWREYGNVQDAVDSYRDNVRDTLNDERSSQHEWAAWEAFDAYVAEHRAAYEATAARELAAAEQAAEDAAAEEDVAYAEFEAWCEAGGYASGLARPGFRVVKASDCAQGDSDMIEINY